MSEVIKKTVETYSKYAKLYADYHADKVLQFQLTHFISLLKGKKILDVGCGSGRDAAYFKEEGYESVGIDMAEGMIEEARKRHAGCNFIKMDMIDIDFEDEAFDGIWMMATLSNLDKKNAGKFLSEIKRVLKDKGVLYIAVKEGQTEGFVKKNEFEENEVYYAYYGKEELENLLKEAGFEILDSAVNNDEQDNWVEIFCEKRG